VSAFVGRTNELQQLTDRLDRALGGEGGVVFITGEAGAGKSTLVERFLIDAALKAREARVISTGCSEQYGAGEPYQPFVDAFRHLVAGGEEAGGRKSFRELAKKLAPYWVAAIPVAGEMIAATMVTAAELKQSMAGGVATTAAPSEEALFFQFTEIFLAAAAEHPIVFFIDDLHWADKASVTLLSHLARQIADKPALIVGTYRPVDIEVAKHPIKQAKLELQRYGVAEELALSALDSAALVEFVEEELGGAASPELVHFLERRAGTNPLFFGELLKWCVEQGVAHTVDGEWHLHRLHEEIETPRSAESVIEKRLSRLDDDSYRVLEYASVEGDEFDSAVLARLLDTDELKLEEQLDPLARKHKLVRLAETRSLPDGEPTSIYEFSHTLIQHVLHKNLKGKRRILLHRKIAGILEEIYQADTEAISHKLAIHFDEGRVADRALECAIVAATRASRVYAHWDAIEFLHLALKNAQTEADKVEVLDRLGDENGLAGHYDEALDRFGAALSTISSDRDDLRTLQLKRKIVVLERECGKRPPEQLREELEALADKARGLEAKPELCEILWNIGRIPGAGAEEAREALAIAEELGEGGLTAKARYHLAVRLWFGENPGDAIPHVNEALSYYKERDDKFWMGRCCSVLAVIYVLLGDYRKAVATSDGAAALFDELGEPFYEYAVRNNLGQLLVRMGKWDEAEDNLSESIRLARRMHATARLLHPLENMGRLCCTKGEDDRAGEFWQQLLDIAKETGYWDSEIVARCGIGTCLLKRGRVVEARDELGRALSLLSTEEWTEAREDTEMLAAQIAVAEGDVHQAIKILETGEEQLASRDRYIWATYRLYHGELLSRSDPDKAIPVIREAREELQQLGAQPMLERAEAVLNQMRTRA